MGLVYWCSDELATAVVLACAAVAPAASVLGQIGAPLSDAWLSDGTDEQVGAEHVFVFLLEGSGVVSKVEDERTHQRIAFLGHAAGTRRQQHRRPLDLGRLLPKERKNGQNKAFLFIVCN